VPEQADQIVAGWVWDSNVRPLVDSVAVLVDYRTDEWDWDAVTFGLDGTDSETLDGWYSYPLVGTDTVTLELANDPGTSVVHVRVRHSGGTLLAARLDTVIAMLNQYWVRACRGST
jgi:hypothetical protein